MREIKFRAWDKSQKIMHFDFQFWKSGDKGNDWIMFISDKQRYSDGVNNPYFRQQLKIMQFTGLLDKNGKEIFEGDIVQVTESLKVVFEWLPVHAAFMTRRLNTKHMYIDGVIENWPHYEILGNIYKNPELLKGE